MAADREVTLFYSPQSRASVTLTLMEELGVPYTLHAVNMKAGENREPAYLAVNPMGKVPAARHGDALITEQVALFVYLADLFPEAGLAPAIGDPLRGPYLRWLVYYGSSFEPAVVDRAMKREPGPASTVPYGDFDTMLKTVVDQIRKGSYLLGDRFTAADVLWGGAFAWTVGFGLVPNLPEIEAYTRRVTSRPATEKARQIDAEYAARHEAAAKDP